MEEMATAEERAVAVHNKLGCACGNEEACDTFDALVEQFHAAAVPAHEPADD